MQKKYVLIFFFMFYKLSAQIGINTQNPKATFEVAGIPDDPNIVDGIIAPRLKLSELLEKKTKYGTQQKGTIVYISNIDLAVDDIADTSYKYITVEGYYFFDGKTWNTLQDLTGVVMFTITLGDGDGTITRQSFDSGSRPEHFKRVDLIDIVENRGNGTWNNTAKTYKIPLTGTYYVTASVRAVHSSPSRDVFINVGNEQADSETALWSHSSNGKFTVQYSRLGYYKAGQEVSLWFFGQNTNPTSKVNIANATLSLLYLTSFGQ